MFSSFEKFWASFLHGDKIPLLLMILLSLMILFLTRFVLGGN